MTESSGIHVYVGRYVCYIYDATSWTLSLHAGCYMDITSWTLRHAGRTLRTGQHATSCTLRAGRMLLAVGHYVLDGTCNIHAGLCMLFSAHYMLHATHYMQDATLHAGLCTLHVRHYITCCMPNVTCIFCCYMRYNTCWWDITSWTGHCMLPAERYLLDAKCTPLFFAWTLSKMSYAHAGQHCTLDATYWMLLLDSVC
jgi:hypothetical protein